MNRVALITVVRRGDFGKPRPTLVIQSDFFDTHPSVTVLPVTSELLETPHFRITVEPAEANGLQKTSQVMVDKAMTIPRSKAGAAFGALDKDTLAEIDRKGAVFLGVVK